MEIRNRVTELRTVRASELVLNKNNWRRHPKEQGDVLRGLLVEIGYADALLVRELPDGRLEIIDGHLRAATTPDIEVPVLVLDVTEEEAAKILVTLDPLAGLAEIDSRGLTELLARVQVDDPAVASFLAALSKDAPVHLPDPLTISEVPAKLDKAAELQAKWHTASGQLWQIGSHKLLCGDCRDHALTERLWRQGGPKIRMIWTDPPYGVNYAKKNEYLNRSDRGNRIQKPIENDELSASEIELLFATALSASIPYCEIGASIYVTVPSGPLIASFMRALGNGGFAFKHLLVWVKNHFVIGMSDYHYRHEPILYGWIENGAHFFTASRSQDSVFEIDRPLVSDLHSTMKPVPLIGQMIANSSRVGELIYDPFCGSSSTLVAAEQLRRIAYGVEVDPSYTAVGLERLAALGLEPKLAEG